MDYKKIKNILIKEKGWIGVKEIKEKLKDMEWSIHYRRSFRVF